MAGNISWIIADKIFRIFTGLIVTAWMARYLGPGNFGIYNYGLAFISFFSILSTLGIDQILLRDIVRYEQDRDEILGTTFLLRFAGSTLCVTFATLTIYILKHGQPVLTGLVFLFSLSTLFQSFEVIEVFFKSKVLIRFPIIAKGIPFILINLFKVVLILSQASLIWFGAAYAIELFLCATGMVIAYKKYKFEIAKWTFGFSRAKYMLRQNLPLFFSSLAVVFYTRFDQILLGGMIDSHSVGIYAAATKITEISYILPVAIITTVAPSLTKLHTQDIDRYRLRTQKFFNIMTLIGFAVIIPAIILSPYIIRLIYGAKYVTSSSVFSIHIWTFLLVSWGVVKELILVTEGNQNVSLYSTVIAMAINICLNLLLIPRLQENGSAVSAVVSQFVSVSLSLLIFRRSRNIVKQQLISLIRFYDIKPD